MNEAAAYELVNNWRVRYVSSGRQYGKQALADAQDRAYEASLAVLREASR